MKYLGIFTLVIALFIGGCHKPAVVQTVINNVENLDPVTVEADTADAYHLALLGLAVDEYSLAAAVAMQSYDTVNGVILPLLNGAVGQASHVIEGKINDAFISKLPVKVQLAISAAFSILNKFIPPSAPDAYLLTDKQVTLLKAFFQGIADGSRLKMDGKKLGKTVVARTEIGNWFVPAGVKRVR